MRILLLFYINILTNKKNCVCFLMRFISSFYVYNDTNEEKRSYSYLKTGTKLLALYYNSQWKKRKWKAERKNLKFQIK